MSKVTKPVRRRRWPRISLRLLLLLIALLCLPLAFWVNPSLRQRRAVAEIKMMRGTVVYGNEQNQKDDSPTTQTPNWLVARLGEDFFYPIVAAEVMDWDWNAKEKLDLEQLAKVVSKMPKCRMLNLRFVKICDEDIAKMKPIANQIESLSISAAHNHKLSASGLLQLKDWTRLKSLSLPTGRFDFQDGDSNVKEFEEWTKEVSANVKFDPALQGRWDH